MNKQEKKLVNEVIKKRAIPPAAVGMLYGTTAVAGLLVGVVLDLAFTAGFGTVVAISTGTLPALAGGVHLSAKFGSMTAYSGQKISGKTNVPMTVSHIQSDLRSSFIAAASHDAPIEKLEKFLKDADEAEEDIKKLSPAFKVVADKAGKFGTEKFQLMTSAQSFTANDTTYITIEKARTIIKDKIEAIKNPPPPPVEPPPVAKKHKFNLD